MVRRLVLVFMVVMATVMTSPTATSADHGEAHGGQRCFTYEETWHAEGCISGGDSHDGQGGYGGRYDYEVWGTTGVTISGGGGQGGAGGRSCFTSQEEECYMGGHGEGGQGLRQCYTYEGQQECYSGGGN